MEIKHKGLWSLAALALGLLTVWAVVSGSGMSLDELAAGIRGARKGWLLLAVLCMLGFIIFEGEAVLVIVRHCGFSRTHRQGYLYGAADVYFSAITPSATGGQPASAFFMVGDGIPGAVVTASLLLNLIMYNAAILTIGLFCLVVRPWLFLSFQPVCKVLIIAGFLVLIGMGLFFFMLLWKREIMFKAAIRFTEFLHRHHLMRHPGKLRQKLLVMMAEYKDCVTMMAGNRRMWMEAYLFNLLQRISQITVALCAYFALRGDPSRAFDLWTTQCFVALGSNCVPIPGSMGVTDYLMLDGYANLVGHDKAFTLQLLSRGTSFYCCVLLAGISVVVGYFLLRRKRKKSSEKSNAENSNTENSNTENSSTENSNSCHSSIH